MKFLDQCARWLLNSSLLLGALMTMAFYALVNATRASVDPWLIRCLTGRWESYVCMAMFFVALAFLMLRMLDTARQFLAMRRPIYKSKPAADATPKALLDQLNQASSTRNSYYFIRLRDALQFSTKQGTPQSLEEHLRNLSDKDRTQMDERYGLIRFITWALPGVGSLGTVLGIAKAVSQISSIESPDLVVGVTGGLAEAFDTFALSLALSILLVSFRFVCEQSEQRLRSTVRKRVSQELAGRLNESTDSSLTQFEQMRQLTERVVEATERLTLFTESSQRDSSERANQDWLRPTELDERKMEKIVAKAMNNAFQQNPSAGIASSAGNTDLAGWQSLQQALQQVAQYLSRQQARQEGEGQVIEQLIQIIDEGSKDEHVPHFASNRRRHVEEEPIVLWK